MVELAGIIAEDAALLRCCGRLSLQQSLLPLRERVYLLRLDRDLVLRRPRISALELRCSVEYLQKEVRSVTIAQRIAGS